MALREHLLTTGIILLERILSTGHCIVNVNGKSVSNNSAKSQLVLLRNLSMKIVQFVTDCMTAGKMAIGLILSVTNILVSNNLQHFP